MKTVRVVAILALAFLALTAIWGAALLMLAPTGSPMAIPVSVLQHSPFHSFLIPGILLLVSSGLLGIAVLAIAIVGKRGYGRWIVFQGCVLFGWITIEVIMLREVVWLHFLYWGIALLLMACGWELHRREVRAPAAAVHTVSAARH